MSWTAAFVGAALIVSHAVVGWLAMLYGKAHPTVVSALAADVAKVEKKL